MLDVPLTTQETLMKYIGGLPAYICNTVFIFDLLFLMMFLFKQRILKQRKPELVYQGNHLQRRMSKEKGMGRKQIQRQ
jgi:hypothetical protein